MLAEGHKNRAGAIFYDAGTCSFFDEPASILAIHMAQGRLRCTDSATAARHLIGLMEAGHTSGFSAE